MKRIFLIGTFTILTFLNSTHTAYAAAHATGGTYTEVGGYGIHKFTSSGTFTPTPSMSVRVLIIAGGGGGGFGATGYFGAGGGGGAGGMLEQDVSVTSNTNYTITIGGGGAGSFSNYACGGHGGESSALGYTSSGGGGGGSATGCQTGAGGGSGGGAGRNVTPGSGTSGQGHNGGTGGTGSNAGGGGGGAGAVGGNGSGTSYGGNGGAGAYSSVFGAYYAGGGGGWGVYSGSGGTGGGGNGGGGNGAANTGGGGGGNGGNGGSGIVIIRYLLITPPTAPTIQSATVLSNTSIKWNFTDNASDEIGFKVYDTNNTLKVTCATANLSSCTETGLTTNTSYTRKVVAYNSAGNSSYSSTASKYTLANAPSTPTITPASASTETVVVNVNSNPSNTEFLIQETGSGKYVNKSTGALQVSESWGTYAEFGSGSGITVTGLTDGTSYTFKVKARNGDSVETAYSSTASGETPIATPTIGSASALSTTSIRWNFTDNSSSETGYRVFDTGNTQKVQCATADVSYCDETGLSVNTQYTRKIAGYNGNGNSSYSSTVNNYTLATTPGTSVVNNAQNNSLDVNPDPNSSPTSTEMVIYKETGASCDGVGGSYLAANGSDNSSTPVWQAESSWATVTATGLSEMTEYSFCVKSRNGDNVETSWSSAVSGTTIESVAPSVSSITSVASDTSATYYDNTDDSSTEIIFSSTDGSGGGVSSCKWDASDVAYDSMGNSCASTSSCTVNLSGEGAKAIYIRCQDIYSNKMTSSQTVNYTIDATAPTTLSAAGSSASWTNAKPTVTVSTPADALSGINEIRYVWDTNNLNANCSGGTTTSATANLTSTLTEGSHILYLCASDNAGNVVTWNGVYKWDNGNPLVNITTHTLNTYRAANIPAKIQGAASDVLSSISSVAVSIYNGALYWSGATFNSASQIWLAATGTTTWEYTFTPSSDGDYTLYSRATDGANNTLVSSATNFTYDATLPIFSTSEGNTPGSDSATITWTTDEAASSQIEYGINNSYGNTTSETDTSPRVTNHSVVLSNLQSCVTYHYRAISKDTAGNTLTGNDRTFTTTGCTGSSTIEEEVADTVTKASGGEVDLQESGSSKIKLTIPANFSSSDADFQIKRLDKDSVVLTTSTPDTAKQIIDEHVYQLDAVTSLSGKISSFDESITITMTYTDAQIVGYDESSLVIYRWDGSSWYVLDNCSVDTVAKTVSCTTDAFSTFILFGEETTVVSDSSSTSSSSENSSNNSCGNFAPESYSDLFQIITTSNSAKLFFTPLLDSSSFHISYSRDLSTEEYAVKTTLGRSGVQNFTINYLQPNTNYYFKLRGIDDCSSSEWSNTMKVKTNVKGATKETVFHKVEIVENNPTNVDNTYTPEEIEIYTENKSLKKNNINQIDTLDNVSVDNDKLNFFQKIITYLQNIFKDIFNR
jgi:hypothetical protein